MSTVAGPIRLSSVANPYLRGRAAAETNDSVLERAQAPALYDRISRRRLIDGSRMSSVGLGVYYATIFGALQVTFLAFERARRAVPLSRGALLGTMAGIAAVLGAAGGLTRGLSVGADLFHEGRINASELRGCAGRAAVADAAGTSAAVLTIIATLQALRRRRWVSWPPVEVAGATSRVFTTPPPLRALEAHTSSALAPITRGFVSIEALRIPLAAKVGMAAVAGLLAGYAVSTAVGLLLEPRAKPSSHPKA
ncbi:MAG: hypothetical protein IPK13_07305 [Deltaproteobacteria bacterium]|nr:hypothetical protein [Deltaproteobacteria bacterium]